MLAASAPAATTGAPHLSWTEAAVVGVLQGVSELFPVSSLGHAVLVPALVGGSWARDLDVSAPGSPYLAFIVGLHVATAAALVLFYRRDWARIVTGLFSSVRHRRITGPDARLGWLLVAATVPVGLVGLVLEHPLRTVLARPVPTAVFLVLNGLVLLLVERGRRRQATPVTVASSGSPAARHRAPTAVIPAVSTTASAPAGASSSSEVATDRRLASLPLRTAVLVGSAQIAALAPGISRSGTTMVAGLRAGLTHQDAARFSFLLATPVIAAAGLLKLPELFGPLGDGIRGQVLLGSVLAGVSSYVAVRFLDRWFAHGSLRPYALYCVLAGLVSLGLLV
ncbi:undecaprenyl-diphosphate phosphatase [Quadrisphaera oryzae]|uniref:undecaprenyl-diphosphate phosphatase n=1 Tax=Quadrisphaera TaxID=317661 RepID=UPI001647EB40|nr:undecaprenyl-diphosphate phosphatase [Quadrisphaera sp. RL12-1S]MBC3763477.1 undecaprenyl-diphosphate phosphatase [Quadrisphaera sp. RL12-1S]